jgi:hypothetical protein
MKKPVPSSGTGKTLNLVSFIEMLEDDKVGLKVAATFLIIYIAMLYIL